MLFRLTSLAVLLTSAFTAEAADGSYNYDETHIWDQVITSSPNECAGSSNSPIAIEDEGCTEFHSYVFEVSIVIYYCYQTCYRTCEQSI
jgi:hypothetical protein